MGFFKDLKKKVRGMQNQMQPPMSPRPTSMGNKFDRMFGMSRRQAPGTVIDLETGLPPVRPPLSNLENIGVGAMAPDKFMPGGGMRLPDYIRYKEGEPVNPEPNFLRRPRRLPQIIPERMPSPRPTPRFFGGGLRSIFAGLPQFMERFEDQRVRERMSPPLPRAPLPMPMPEDMPRERFPMMRPRFAEGEDVDINEILETQSLRDEMLNTKSGFFEFEEPFNTRNISDTNMLIAEQGAREGISPAEMATQRIKQFLADSGRTVSNRDAELYGMGMLTLEDIMQRAEPVTNRNLMQQEQMFFPESKPTDQRLNRMLSAGRGTASSLDDILEDLEKKN